MKSKPVVPPIYMSATYKFDTSDDLIDVVQNRTGFIYSRWDNPTVMEVEKTLASMEGYDHALGFGSGMAAITNSIMAFTNQESRIIAIREVYGGTHEFLFSFLPTLGIDIITKKLRWSTTPVCLLIRIMTLQKGKCAVSAE